MIPDELFATTSSHGSPLGSSNPAGPCPGNVQVAYLLGPGFGTCQVEVAEVPGLKMANPSGCPPMAEVPIFVATVGRSEIRNEILRTVSETMLIFLNKRAVCIFYDMFLCSAGALLLFSISVGQHKSLLVFATSPKFLVHFRNKSLKFIRISVHRFYCEQVRYCFPRTC